MRPSLSIDAYAAAVGCRIDTHDVLTDDGFVLQLHRLCGGATATGDGATTATGDTSGSATATAATAATTATTTTTTPTFGGSGSATTTTTTPTFGGSGSATTTTTTPTFGGSGSATTTTTTPTFGGSGGGFRPILLLPGLLQTAGTYLVGYNSLAVHLLRSGFDVWLGNNRGGLHPEHVSLSTSSPTMWDWDVTDMALHDVPALLSAVSALRNDTTPVSVVAHSQGTTQCLLLLQHGSPPPHDAVRQLDRVVLLAPALFTGPLFHTLPLLTFMRSLSLRPPLFRLVFGPTAFMPLLMRLRTLVGRLPGYSTLAYAVFAAVFHWDDALWDRTVRSHLFMSSPAYVSTKTVLWWLHEAGAKERDSVTLPLHTPPILAVVAGNDRLVDGSRFIEWLHSGGGGGGGSGSGRSITIPEYAHLDVLWAHDVVERVGRPVVQFLSAT